MEENFEESRQALLLSIAERMLAIAQSGLLLSEDRRLLSSVCSSIFEEQIGIPDSYTENKNNE